MLTYCLNCKKDTKNVDLKLLKNGKTMISSKCAACSSKKSRFLKEQEAKGLLSSLGLKTDFIVRQNIVLIIAISIK